MAVNFFESRKIHVDLSKCGIYSFLPPEDKDFIDEHPIVLKYLHTVPNLDKIGVPRFFTRLSRKLSELKQPNIIYKIKNTSFVHIMPNLQESRNYYIPIEATQFYPNVRNLMSVVEDKLLDLVENVSVYTIKEKEQYLRSLLSKIFYIDDEKEKKHSILQAVSNILHKNKISITQEEFEHLQYEILKEKLGLGRVQPLLDDPYIEDITCGGVGNIFVEHKIFHSLITSIVFETEEELDRYIIQITERIGKPVSFANPIVDAVLFDGSRINVVFGTDVSKRGSNFTIRKFSKMPLSILQLIEYGTLNYEMAAYLWILIRNNMCCFISGETASGKTTTLNALTCFIRPEAKIVSIEDTPELQVPHDNWTREVTRQRSRKDLATISMYQLLKAALRQRPNEILVGEIRGEEGHVAFSAMQTGHPVMSTFHASSVQKLLQRLTGDPINVPKTYIDNLNLVIIQQSVRHPKKGLIRRITSVNEIVGYDSHTENFSFMESFSWDPEQDTFIFRGRRNSYLLEQKIAPMLGIPEHKKKIIYDELDRRAELLKKLNKSKIYKFYDLFEALRKLETQNIFR